MKKNPVVCCTEHRQSSLESPRQVRQTTANTEPVIDFHGASIINEQGKEIPITEAMVQQACKTYIQQWEIAQKSAAND
ncbi:PA1571 family protein [Kaarinaea lacus]